MLTSCSFLSDPTVGSDSVLRVTPVDVEKGRTIFISISLYYYAHTKHKLKSATPTTKTQQQHL